MACQKVYKQGRNDIIVNLQSLIPTSFYIFNVFFFKSCQGCIEPPKAARGHATYIDGKMLSVTKYSFQIYFRFHTCNDASAIANR